MNRQQRVFSAVRTEGGLLPQDMLSRIHMGDPNLDGTKAETYHLGPHERIGEAAEQSWHRLRAFWHVFQAELGKLAPGAPTAGLTRERWLLPLFHELGYGRLPKGTAIAIGDHSFAISHTWHRSPIHLLGWDTDLDKRQKGVAGAAKSSPHGLVQDFLNRSDEHLWGFLSNGNSLRILRDHHSLTRQAYVEFDLQAIMDGDQYSEFLLLWLLCHQSRVEADKPHECWLERWALASRDQGVRALDKLRDGVERAIVALGSGFLAHRANQELQQALRSGVLDSQEYYHQILRLVYRMIFLFAAEERDALLDPGASKQARERYLRFYTTRRLRDLSDKRRGGPHGDLWRGLALVMDKLDNGCAELALPALGSRLWGPTACPWLMPAECANEHLLSAVRHLAHIQEGRTRYPVNWRNIGADELGSIYESLLELHPRIHRQGGTFELDTAAGHERKTTGSYYTPTSLVDCLLDSALDPVLDEAARKPDAEAAILGLKVCDPACGSGHFLVAAARRIARRLAAVRSGDDEPSPRDVQKALRDVVGHCVFGVDLNPMAVELCKVSMWMEALEPGKPLSFLDSHIVSGDALLGATPALMSRGIPDEAFQPIEGDDPEVATRLRGRNRQERLTGQTSLFGMMGVVPSKDLAKVAAEVDAIEKEPDEDIQALRNKQRRWEGFQRLAEFKEEWFRADAWCAAFVWPKQKGELEHGAITQDLWRRICLDVTVVPKVTKKTVHSLAQQHRFLHWHLAFPQVFGKSKATFGGGDTTGWTGGFDVVLGNPPWERIKLQEKEFFATRDEGIAKAKNAAARKKAIAKLERGDPALWGEWCAALREANGASHIVRDSGRYPLCGRGDVNTYSIFAELNRTLMSPTGRTGCILPSGIAMDATTQFYFRDLVETRTLASLYHFENEDRIFPGVHHAFRFCLLTLSGNERPVPLASFVAYARAVAAIEDEERIYELSAEDFECLNPNTKNFPAFRSRFDAEITKAIYRRVPVLVREATAASPEVNPWGVSFKRMLDMANDSGLFRTREELEREGWVLTGNVFERGTKRMLPLYEAKMVHLFDHRFSTYQGQTEAQARQGKLPEATAEQHADASFAVLPRYWVAQEEVEQRLDECWDRGWMLGWRDICRSVDKRTVIASVVPRVGVGHTTPLFLPDPARARLAGHVAANLSSFALDFAARQKIGGTHLTYGSLKQIPVLTPSAYARLCPFSAGEDLATWFAPRVIELTYTAWELAPFARDHGYDGPPYRWDEDRRFLLRCELDAAFFHLYGLDRHEVGHVMGSFWVVRNQDVKDYGDYRTKVQILEIFDAMQHAIDTGEPYQTLLNPAPAHESQAHPSQTHQEMVQALADLTALPPAAWARPRTDAGVETGAALLALLKQLSGATPIRDIRLAVALVLEPHLLVPSLDTADAAAWRRLIGSEAEVGAAGPIATDALADRAWGAAVSHLRGTGLLVENLAAATWAPGLGLDSIPTNGWPDGRVSFVLQRLEEVGADRLLRALPEQVRRSIDAAAA